MSEWVYSSLEIYDPTTDILSDGAPVGRLEESGWQKSSTAKFSRHTSGGLMMMAMICSAHNDSTISAVDYRVVLCVKIRNNTP